MVAEITHGVQVNNVPIILVACENLFLYEGASADHSRMFMDRGEQVLHKLSFGHGSRSCPCRMILVIVRVLPKEW